MAETNKISQLNDLIDNSQREKIGKQFLLKAVEFAVVKEFGKSYEFFKIGLDTLTCDSDQAEYWLKPYQSLDKALFDDFTHESDYEYYFVKAYILSYKSDVDQLQLALNAINIYLKYKHDEYGYYVKGKILLGLKDIDQAYISFMISHSFYQSARLLYQIGIMKEEFLQESGLKELYISFLKNPSSACCGITLRKYAKKHGIMIRYKRYGDLEDNILLQDFAAYEDEDWEFSVTFNLIQNGKFLPEDSKKIMDELVEVLKKNRESFIEEEDAEIEEKNEDDCANKNRVSNHFDPHYYGDRFDEYNGYNGYSDDEINDVFDGDPEATWNVD